MHKYFVSEMCFWHKWVISKYHPSWLIKLVFKGNIFSFIKLLTIFSAVFRLLLMVVNSKIYNSNYPNTIWWMIRCILWVNYETKNTSKPSMTLFIGFRHIWKLVWSHGIPSLILMPTSPRHSRKWLKAPSMWPRCAQLYTVNASVVSLCFILCLCLLCRLYTYIITENQEASHVYSR